MSAFVDPSGDTVSKYVSTLTSADNSALAVNLRLESFDSSMAMVTDATYAVDSDVTAMDFSATAVIFVRTEDIRSTFQFAVDADHLTDVGSAAFDAGVRFYVFDKYDVSLVDASLSDLTQPPTWRWDVSASDADASYIIQPAHGMMDVSLSTLTGHVSSHEVAFSQADIVEGNNSDGNLREDRLVKQDFIRHISKSVLGSADLAGLFNNVDELMLEIENGGVVAWDSIRSNLAAARDANPQTQFQVNSQTNPTRSLYRQLFKRNPDRFDASGNDAATMMNKITTTPNPQPLPFIHGDILEFKFVVDSAAVSVPDPSGNKKTVAERTYRVKMCLVDGSGNDDQHNTTPPNYVYDYGVNVTDISANNKDGKVEALDKHQKYYILDKAGTTLSTTTPTTTPSGGSGGGGGGDETIKFKHYNVYNDADFSPPTGVSVDGTTINDLNTTGTVFVSPSVADSFFIYTWKDAMGTFGDTYSETYTQHVVNNLKLPLDNVKIYVLNDKNNNVPGIYNVSYIADFIGFNEEQFVLLRVQALASTLPYLSDNIAKYNSFASRGKFSSAVSTQYAVTIEQQSN